MVSFVCLGLGEFLTFASMVLSILINMGQISNNIVARNIEYTSLTTTGFGTAAALATDQSAPELAGNGLKDVYKWGLYNFCAGASSGSDRSCAPRSFGYKYQPYQVLQADISTQYSSDLTTAVTASTFTDSDYLGRFSKPASYISFVATIVIGVSFLIAFLAHRFAFLLASLLALAAAALMFVSAAIWTAIIYKTRHSLTTTTSGGLHVSYGNAIWMEWGAAVAALLSVVPLLIACLSGRRSKY